MEEKDVKKRVPMKVGRVQKRIISYMLSDINDAVVNGETSDGESPNSKAMTRIAYKYAPYLIEEYDDMPKPVMEELDGVPIRTADIDWIVENIDFNGIMDMLNTAFEVNNLMPKEKKTSKRQSSRRTKKRKTENA